MAAKLALACVDAFDPKARGCYVPDGDHAESYKASATYRGDFTTDSAGRLLVAIAPSPWNDTAQLFVSNGPNQSLAPSLANGDATGIWLCGTSTGLMNGNCISLPALPFASNLAFDYNPVNSLAGVSNVWSATPGAFARVVSASVKCIYTGNSLNDGGVMYSFVEPNHDSLENEGQSYWSQFTSMKHTALTSRAEQEITLFGIRTDMREFSPYIDLIPQNVSNGLATCYPVSNTQTVCGYAVGHDPINPYANAGNQEPLPMEIDIITRAKYVSKTLYPLQRLDSRVSVVTIGQSSFSITTDGSGKVTSAFPFSINYSGCYVILPSGDPMFFLWSAKDNSWYGKYKFGAWATSATVAASTYFYMLYSSPCPLGIIQVNAGTANPNQTVHVEYTIHCEYSGVACQGRMTANPPDKHLTDIVHVAVRTARDLAGQHPGQSVRTMLPQALNKIAKSVSPAVVDAIIGFIGAGPAGGTMGMLAGLSGVKRLR